MARSKKYVISSGAKRSREILALSGAEMSIGSAGGTSSVPTGRKCVDPSASLGMTGLFCGGTISVPTDRKCVDPSTSLGMTGLFCGGTISVPADRKCVDPSTSLGMTGLFCGGTIWVPTGCRRCSVEYTNIRPYPLVKFYLLPSCISRFVVVHYLCS